MNPSSSPQDIETADSSSLETDDTAAAQPAVVAGAQPAAHKKDSFIRRSISRINVYMLAFVFTISVAGIIAGMTYLASRETKKSSVPTQTLNDTTLKQLAESDVTVGQPKQILSVQSNAIFAGKVLVRDSLEVAGPIQVGGALNIPGITVSGNSVFEDMRINKTLSVAGDSTLQGQLNVQKNLNVSGGGNFGGNVSANQISTNNLQMNGMLNVTKHFGVGGATPGRSSGPALGSGGTVSVGGSDTAGTININTGSNPSAGCFTTVTFTQRFNGTPRVLLTPVGPGAANLGHYVTRSNISFSVCSVDPPPASATFGFDYFVIEST